MSLLSMFRRSQPIGVNTTQHLVPPVAVLRRMTPKQLSALYATLPPGSQIAGFPPPNADYFPNPDGTNPAASRALTVSSDPWHQIGVAPTQHLVPPVDQLRKMTPAQLSAVYARLPPGTQIAGFPPPNAFYFPNPDGTNPATVRAHGEDAGDAASPGATDDQSPNYDSVYDQLQTQMAGTINQSIADYEAGTMDAGTMQMASFDNIGESAFDPIYWDPSMLRPDNAQRVRMAPTGYDVYDVPEQVPNKRNYLATFGLDDDFYSGWGPAAIVGCDIGCGLDTKVRG